MAYEDFKHLTERTASDIITWQVLGEKAFNIARNPKHDRYHRGLASMLYNSFDKKPGTCTGRAIKNKTILNQ